MATTTRTAKNVFVVINQDNTKKEPLSKTLDKETLQSLSNYGDYYTILHDRFSKSEGDETTHRHLLIIGADSLASSVWIEALSLIFKVPRNCVQLESVTNPRKCGRYLVHRDQELKFQFPPEEVQTNNKRQFENWLMGGKVTAHVITHFNGGYLDFLEEFGAENTKRYFPMVEKAREEKRRLGQIAEIDQVKAELENTQTALRDVKRDLLAIVSQTLDKTWPRSLLETNKSLKRDVESFMYELQERIKNL